MKDSDNLNKDLSDPGAIPEQAIDQAVALMRTGRLHRYGEYSGTQPHAALLEIEFAQYVGARYAIGVNSGGCALFLALKVCGVRPGDPVLVNGFNLAPVPGAIAHAGAEAVLVEIGDDYMIDFADLEKKASASGAKVLMLTHMRGHIVDMDAIAEICKRLDITLIEDCAHTMGAKWGDTFTGRFGQLGCFSTQTFKHINSGEGGLIVTDDDDMAAKAILYSGSYMLYGQHQSAPPAEVFERWKKHIPNFSMRMSNLVAAILRPQLQQMSERGELWNRHYAELETLLNNLEGVCVPPRDARESFVASSIQFHVADLNYDQLQDFADSSTSRGVAIKWFGREEPIGYTSLYQHWAYLQSQSLPETERVLRTTCDMRIPLSLTSEDCTRIANILSQELERVRPR
ncbi:MAG: DegT/DnrJ/EryC1/StrS aminotransferase family protein [Pseudomonadota bacterium]